MPLHPILLAQRIAEERMTELHPHGSAPDFVPEVAARIYTMDADGEVTPDWQWPDAVDWWNATAYRLEDAYGNALDPQSKPDWFYY